MRLDKPPEYFYVCRGCHFVHHDQYNIDKCPSCKDDDWIVFGRLEEDDEYFEEDYEEVE